MKGGIRFPDFLVFGFFFDQPSFMDMGKALRGLVGSL